jgi:hypothetical protein
VIDLGGRIDGRVKGTLHPNAAGQSVIGEAIAADLEHRFFPGQVFFRPPVRTVVKGRSLSLLGVAALALAALGLVGGAGVAWHQIDQIAGVGAGITLGLVGIALVGLGVVLRDSLLAGAGASVAGGATVAFGLLTWRRAA